MINDIHMPNINNLKLLSRIDDIHPDLPVIITTAHSDLNNTITSYQNNAFEYLPKPFDMDEVIATTQHALQHAEKNKTTLPEEQPLENTKIINETPTIQKVFHTINQLSQSNITVLINNKSNTNKELVTQTLHHHNPHTNKPFITLNMTTIPKNLMKSKLFNHKKSTFTDTTTQHHGHFKQTNYNTLFLNEINDIPTKTQTHLLQILTNNEFYHINNHTPIKINVHIITTTHQNLEKLIQNNNFQKNLFHHLNIIHIHLPKLTEHHKDIPKLIQHFFTKTNNKLNIEPKHLLPDTEKYLNQLN